MSEVTLDNWSAYARPLKGITGFVEIRLAGDVTGHPKLGDGSITTSPVKRWVGHTVRTQNTTYTLKDFAGKSGVVKSLELLTSEERSRWFDDEDPIKEEVGDEQQA